MAVRIARVRKKGSSTSRRPAVTTLSLDTKRRVTRSNGIDQKTFEGLKPDVAHAWRHQNLGRLLLFAFHTFEARLLDEYAAAGFVGFRQVHLNVMRYIDSRTGTRIVDLATRAGVTKGAMGQLVEECLRLGLVQLQPDPSDGRAKIVSYSPLGRKFMKVTRRAIERIERDFGELLGEERYDRLRRDLVDLRERIVKSRC